MEVSVVTEGSVMDVSAEMEVETTGHPLRTSTPQKKEPVEWHLCPECGKSYAQKRNLVRHRKQHHNLDAGPRFSCSQCDKKFTMSDDLHSHVNSVHLKIKPFKCETRKKSFAHKRSLEPGRHSCKVNAQVHVCDHCGKVFKSRGSLQEHAHSHDGSLPYSCKKCFTCFRYRNQLRRHSQKCLP